MKTYIYPENLRSAVRLWFWNVRDFIIICAGVVISVMILLFTNTVTEIIIANILGKIFRDNCNPSLIPFKNSR